MHWAGIGGLIKKWSVVQTWSYHWKLKRTVLFGAVLLFALGVSLAGRFFMTNNQVDKSTHSLKFRLASDRLSFYCQVANAQPCLNVLLWMRNHSRLRKTDFAWRQVRDGRASRWQCLFRELFLWSCWFVFVVFSRKPKPNVIALNPKALEEKDAKKNSKPYGRLKPWGEQTI